VASVSRPRVCVVFSTLKPAFLRFLLARSLRLAKPTWRGRSIADHPASEGHRSKSRCRCGHQVGARLLDLGVGAEGSGSLLEDEIHTHVGVDRLPNAASTVAAS
jgi:hypothetical protein